MGLAFIDGLSWDQVTRDERFFCAWLYFKVHQHGAHNFVSYLNQTHGMKLDETANWEVGYEVCFYRDYSFYHGNGAGSLPAKRTFDLCLMSDQAIVIIEAKAQQSFSPDQLGEFKKDPCQIKTLLPEVEVYMIGLCSSQCKNEEGLEQMLRDYGFNGPLLTWEELASYYGKPILSLADDIYMSPERLYRKSCEELVKGESLFKLVSENMAQPLWVGRLGGARGKKFQEDIRSGKWRFQEYETNSSSQNPPSPNWFSLQEFYTQIKQYHS